MKSLSLQGEFIKRYRVSLLGAVYFGVAGPGGKGKRNPSNLPFLGGPQNSRFVVKRKGGKEGREQKSCLPLLCRVGSRAASCCRAGLRLAALQHLVLLFPRAAVKVYPRAPIERAAGGSKDAGVL